jgi:YVTN family beta-propeller protein
MSFRLQAAVAAASVCLVVAGIAGCGTTFRPTILPQTQGGGDPQPFARAIVVSNNSGGAGSAANIDVTGDSNIFNVATGNGPVYAAAVGANMVIANRAEDTLTAYNQLVTPPTPLTVSLPTGAQPVFVNSKEAATVYVADFGLNEVSAVSTSTFSVTGTIPVGTNPISIAELPNASKVYVANFGGGVSVIATVNKTVTTTVAVGSNPVFALASPDSSLVFVVNQGSGTVSVIQTSTDTVTATLTVGSSPNYAFYDPALQRVYVTNTGSGDISVIDANSTSPTFLQVIALSIPTGAGPTSIAVLPDGSKAYVANSGIAAPWAPGKCGGAAPGTVSVINALSFTKLHDITVQNTPISLAASPNNNRVTVANCDSDSISEINTTNDTVVTTLPAAAPKPVWVAPGR